MIRLRSWVCCIWLVALPELARDAVAQEANAATRDRTESFREEDARELAILERFVAVLEKNPRKGTALDKVYAFHVERGSLDSLIAANRARAEKVEGTAEGPRVEAKAREAASIWMIVGLLESLRGHEAAAITAYEKAESLDATNALASYYLGQTQVLAGQSDKAAESMERAIARWGGTGGSSGSPVASKGTGERSPLASGTRCRFAGDVSVTGPRLSADGSQ